MPKGRECVRTVTRIGEELTCARGERACSFLPLCPKQSHTYMRTRALVTHLRKRWRQVS